jgi:hypothetical protein
MERKQPPKSRSSFTGKAGAPGYDFSIAGIERKGDSHRASEPVFAS